MKSGRRLLGCLLAAISAGVVAGGCGGNAEPPAETDVLLTMGDSILRMQDVVRRIPVGLSHADSVAIFHKIVYGWVESMVLSDMAKSRLADYDEIERRVNEYRNRLMVMSYLSAMRSSSGHKASERSIREFYDSHRREMLSERPLVKGVLLKVSSSVRGLDEIRRCVFTATDQTLDELERKWATDAIQYDYFEHTWVDWQKVAEQIPYRFFDPDAFLQSTKNFETENDGTVYLLHISDYLPTGSELPYEFASPRIAGILETAKISKYERDLVESLIKRAMSEDKLQAVGYDPVNGRLLTSGGDEREKRTREIDEK